MDQPDFDPLHEAGDQKLLLEQPVGDTECIAVDAAATKSNCIDCGLASNNQFSPLFVPASSSLEPRASKAPFASLVERARFLW